jgi:subtilisin family serine protease
MRKVQAAALALLLVVMTLAPERGTSAARIRRDARGRAPGEIIVKLKKSSPALELAAKSEHSMALARLASKDDRVASARAVEPVARRAAGDRKIDDLISERGLDRVFVLKYDADADTDSIIAALRESGEVEYAEPNYRIELGSLIPNDPVFSAQWSLKNIGLYVGEYPATPDADIKAPEAWALTTGSPDVVVAVTDTGVDLTHPDLDANIYTNRGEVPANGKDDDGNGYVDDVHGYNVADGNGDTSDIVGHGTQMAGVIAAEMDNGIGIAGISQSKILPVRFFRKSGPAPEEYDASIVDAVRALLYSIAAGATIINASWKTLLYDATVGESRALEDAVAATNDAGILFVSIAGNEGYNLDYSKLYPAFYKMPNQIVVAASDFNDEIWHPPFYPYQILTGFGPNSVHLSAPGVSVMTTAARGNCILCSNSDETGNWYVSADGTSISGAYVSGVAALVKSRYPDASAFIIRRRILEGVEGREQLREYVITSGRLSAHGALTVPISITPPTLDRIKYKAGGGKLYLYGSNIQKGATVIVATKSYTSKPKSEDLTAVLARVPTDAFPSGVTVSIKLRNPDGGESQVIRFTR